MAVAVGLVPLVPPKAKAHQESAICGVQSPTIVGTSAADELIGTPGSDVIDGGAGADRIDGRGGHDVLMGGSGDDELAGGPGTDALVGGNGNDALVGADGADGLCGENGDDLLIGALGPDYLRGGNGSDLLVAGVDSDIVEGSTGVDLVAGGSHSDILEGGQGNDAIGGGDGDDTLVGDQGSDRLAGSAGVDFAAGGQGVDGCSAEQRSTCETDMASGTQSITIAPPEPLGEGSAYRVEWSATASAGLSVLELYADDRLIDFQAADRNTEGRGSFEFTLPELPAPQVSLYVVLTDGNGEQARSNVMVLDGPTDSRPVTPQAAIQLVQPMAMSDLVERLRVADVVPLTYYVYDAPTSPPEPDGELLAELARDGLEVHVPTEVSIIYTPQDTPLEDQAAEFAAYYAFHEIGGEPLVSGVVAEGPLRPGDLHVFGSAAILLGNAPAPSASVPSPSTASLAEEAAAPPPSKPKSGRTAAPHHRRSSRAVAQAQLEDAFWPSYGRFNVREVAWGRTVTQKHCELFGVFICEVSHRTVWEEKAELQHELVWDSAVLNAFDSRSHAYEHNVKVRSPGREGTRPFCKDDGRHKDFYIRTRGSKFIQHTLPDEAQLYNDIEIIGDACSSNEVSFGIVHPENIDVDVPPGMVAVFLVHQESERNDEAHRWFQLQAQKLSRDNVNCDRLPGFVKYACIGADTRDTDGADLAGTDVRPELSSTLPTCVVWKWLPNRPLDQGPNVLKRCGHDRDQDGYDDQVDCAPDDPTISPGAVDIPNDGIDQNCDGDDLSVGEGKIRVTLLWDNDNDLDLHVTEPGGTEIWYSSPGPTVSGGRLDRDDNVAVCGFDAEPGGVENVFWPQETTPPAGTYRVEVVEYNRCSSPSNWTVEVRFNQQIILRQTGQGEGSFSFLPPLARKGAKGST